MANEAHNAELAIIISYPKSANGIIVFLNSVRLYSWKYSLILLDFNFIKRPEFDVAKTTTSGKSNDMRAVCKLS